MQKCLKRAIIVVITGIRPLLGPATCQFEQGCTQYAVEQLETRPLVQALLAIIKRVLSCNPISGMLRK